MSRPRRDPIRGREDTTTEIKATARRQMAGFGAAGLSLRAIGREMGFTAPAIYNYFPRLDDLITALIVDAFTALATSMEAAGQAAEAEGPIAQIRATALAYRKWAVEHPVDFQLIYGTSIPGYEAPAETTAPLARRPFVGMLRYFAQARAIGALAIPPEYEEVPPHVAAHIAGWQHVMGAGLPAVVVGLVIAGWARMHGLVMLELTHHSQPVVGDPEGFYRYELDAFLARLGVQPAGTQKGQRIHALSHRKAPELSFEED
jgi:AcrR family transcriptional regulator